MTVSGGAAAERSTYMRERKPGTIALTALVCALVLGLTGCAGTESTQETAKAQEAEETVTAKLAHHDSREDLLVLVDFQNVYLPGQPWACPTMEKAMDNTLAVINAPGAPDYILTQYMAPEDPTGCWVRYNEEYADINADPFLCDFADPIKPLATGDKVIVKSTYSSLDSPALQAMLAGKERIVLTGVVAECCVLATMMDAIDLGVEVIYLDDCIAGCSAENEQMIRTLAQSFSPMHTQVMTAQAYLETIAPES